MSSLNDFRAREEQLRKLDQELNDKKAVVVRRAEELVKQQSDRLSRLAADAAPVPASSYGAGGSVHHPYGDNEQGFLEETTGFRGRYEAPAVAAAAAPSSRSHARPVSAASQDGRRRSSAIPTPASHSVAHAAPSAAVPAARAASASRITPSALSSASSSSSAAAVAAASHSRPHSRTSLGGAAAAAPRSSSRTSAAGSRQQPQQQQQQPLYGDDGGEDGGYEDAANDADLGGADGGSGGGEEDDGDMLGFGGEDGAGGAGGAGAGSAAGMGTAATLRFQKARLQALSSNVAVLTSTLSARDKELADLKSLVKGGSDSREKLLRAKEALERSNAASQKSLDELAAKAHSSDAKVATLERELAAASKRRAELESEAKSRDAKLNRALQELERSKELMSKMRSGGSGTSGGGGGSSGGGGGVDDVRSELSALKLTNKKLLQQRVELLGGFKKQSKLIELIKRQKLHVEMAKMLQFTEEEFAKTLETGEL